MTIASQISAGEHIESQVVLGQPATQTMDHEDEILTIRQMCDSHDVTPRALRFYEARGLLSPQRVGQHRLYNRRDRGRLRLILQGKRFGFSLDQLSHLLELYDPSTQNRAQISATLDTARARLADMRQQAQELTAGIDELAARIAETEAAYARLVSDTASRPV